MFGAALVPLSQACCSTSIRARSQGSAMALLGVASWSGPMLGPVLGGWLTENYSWRWVFYINLPVGVLAFLGLLIFLPRRADARRRKLDWFGFGTLSLAIGALQLLLDRGEQLDWFGSAEIWIEAIIAALGVLSLPGPHLHGATQPFVHRACSSIAISRPACSSSRSSASPTRVPGAAAALSAEPDGLSGAHCRHGAWRRAASAPWLPCSSSAG